MRGGTGIGTETIESYLIRYPTHSCGEQLIYQDSFHVKQRKGGLKLPDGKIAKWTDLVEVYSCDRCKVYSACGKEFRFGEEAELNRWLSSLDHKDIVKATKVVTYQGKISRLLKKLLRRNN